LEPTAAKEAKNAATANKIIFSNIHLLFDYDVIIPFPLAC